eukprot:sb/3476455/
MGLMIVVGMKDTVLGIKEEEEVVGVGAPICWYAAYRSESVSHRSLNTSRALSGVLISGAPAARAARRRLPRPAAGLLGDGPPPSRARLRGRIVAIDSFESDGTVLADLVGLMTIVAI